MTWFVAAACLLPPLAAAQQQEPAEWAKLPRMQFERQFAGPLQDTITQRWRDPVDGTICTIYLPIMALHSPPTASGFVQYGPNTIGSISCTGTTPAATAPPNTPAPTGIVLVGLIIQLIAGVAGGNVAGAALRDYNCGLIGNTLAGAIGGVGIGQLVQVLMPALFRAGDGLDVGAMVAQIVVGGVGGAILTLIAGLVKGVMTRR